MIRLVPPLLGSSLFGLAVMGRMSGDVITPIPREIQEKLMDHSAAAWMSDKLTGSTTFSEC
jgi:hypothetical protein